MTGVIVMSLIIPKGYRSDLTARQTQIAIKKVKDFFQTDQPAQPPPCVGSGIC